LEAMDPSKPVVDERLNIRSTASTLTNARANSCRHSLLVLNIQQELPARRPPPEDDSSEPPPAEWTEDECKELAKALKKKLACAPYHGKVRSCTFEMPNRVVPCYHFTFSTN